MIAVLKLMGPLGWRRIYEAFCYEEFENAIVIVVYFNRLARHLLYGAYYI
jgi:hypothetical protein